MLIEYARVSTQDQTLNLQTDALQQAGCEKVYTDTTSGAKTDRPGLQETMNQLRAGDTLVVWRLDRLGRTLKHLITLVYDLNDHGIGFKSLREQIDTTTSGGRLIFHIFGSLAEFEREIIRERTNAGLQAARARAVRWQAVAPSARPQDGGARKAALCRPVQAGKRNLRHAPHRKKHTVPAY